MYLGAYVSLGGLSRLGVSHVSVINTRLQPGAPGWCSNDLQQVESFIEAPLSLTRVHARELSGTASAKPWHPLISSSGLPFPHRFVSLSEGIAIPYSTISSSSIDSLVTHVRLACSLPYTPSQKLY